MADYTPTTDEVRKCYDPSVASRFRDVPNEGFAAAIYAEFDRWLAQHDAEVRAEAADQIEEAAMDPELGGSLGTALHAVQREAFLTAARIVRGEQS